MYPDDDLAIVVLANGDFANVDRLARMATRVYLRKLPDPQAESAKPDPDPARTASVVAALKAVAAGRIDASVMHPDALDPLSVTEASGFLKEAGSFGYAGGRRLAGQGLVMHGHTLVDYVTVRLQMKSESHFLTLYRDDRGRVAYLELTE
jgi:hypothetical protein